MELHEPKPTSPQVVVVGTNDETLAIEIQDMFFDA
jgi:hypothetical protein